jgi:hypothetical protein
MSFMAFSHRLGSGECLVAEIDCLGELWECQRDAGGVGGEMNAGWFKVEL